MDSLSDIFKKPEEGYAKDLFNRHKYVTKEFQDFGYRIAVKLGDEKKAAMYIKLAKEQPRALLEQAFSFAIDYPKAKDKSRLFLWKLKQLREERAAAKSRDGENNPSVASEEIKVDSIPHLKKPARVE